SAQVLAAGAAGSDDRAIAVGQCRWTTWRPGGVGSQARRRRQGLRHAPAGPRRPARSSGQCAVYDAARLRIHPPREVMTMLLCGAGNLACRRLPGGVLVGQALSPVGTSPPTYQYPELRSSPSPGSAAAEAMEIDWALRRAPCGT